MVTVRINNNIYCEECFLFVKLKTFLKFYRFSINLHFQTVPKDVPYISRRHLTGFVDNGNSESLRKTIECQIASNILGLVKEFLSFSANSS
jgi:hypothetical protein